jgi:hypothetical protein
MKTQELRIGNILKGETREGSVLVANVHEILECEVSLIFEGRVHRFTHDRIEPIPLTPEILTACGFIWDGECWNFDGFRIWDSATANAAKSEYYHINSETLTNFDFLHHLQNYYHAVSTEELEYKPK